VLGGSYEWIFTHCSRCNDETLKVYLHTNGQKKDPAERLFIVRQTLYHRSEKIKQLLGPDFMQTEKRLALELMLFTDK
jgi:PucR family transcriptional regulator, purine catabolism regulatory protein